MCLLHEAGYRASRLALFLTLEERRYGQWENVGVVGRRRRGQPVAGVPKGRRAAVDPLAGAAKETVASTRTIRNMAEAFIMYIQQRGNDGALYCVLDAPTNEAWIQPWSVLERRGVRFRMGQPAVALHMAAWARAVGHRARPARAPAAGRRRLVRSATPAERIAPLLSRSLLAADPALGILPLQVDWMAGIQHYPPKKIDLTHGHVTYVDAPWALTSLTQAQFGRRHFPCVYATAARRTACRWTSPTGTLGAAVQEAGQAVHRGRDPARGAAPDHRAPQGHRSGDPADAPRRARSSTPASPGTSAAAATATPRRCW